METVTRFWEPYVRNQSPGSAQWGNDAVQATLPIRINYREQVQVFREILGYSRRSGNDLVRTLPKRHPTYYWLFANQITNIVHEVPDGTVGKEARYKYTKCDVVFSQLPYDVLPNEQVSNESERFVKKIFEPNVEAVALERGEYKFENTQIAFPGAALFLPKANWIWTWYHVPHKWLYGDGEIPTKIMDAVAKVNDAEFHGAAEGTMLLLNPRITPSYPPDNPLIFGLGSSGLSGRASIEHTVELPFLYDPNKHNFKPHPDTHVPTLIEDGDNNPLYEPTNYNDIFGPA